MPPASRLLVVVALTAGCSWFKELQSADSAEDSGSGSGTAGDGDASDGSGSSGTGGGPCTIANDDRCVDQDTLRSCDEATGEVTESSCNDLCTGTLNFSCVIATAEAQHGCWCVVPGDLKLLTCTELESCLLDCGGANTTACADACFDRTTSGTIRTYGALVSCAHHGCDDTCRDTPEGCAACISSAINSGAGDCVLERSVCDADAPSDPWWPD
jgi:hypothetical protein